MENEQTGYSFLLILNFSNEFSWKSATAQGSPLVGGPKALGPWRSLKYLMHLLNKIIKEELSHSQFDLFHSTETN